RRWASARSRPRRRNPPSRKAFFLERIEDFRFGKSRFLHIDSLKLEILILTCPKFGGGCISLQYNPVPVGLPGHQGRPEPLVSSALFLPRGYTYLAIFAVLFLT
ncbi:MAG: hypothetical protein RI842_08590, partial [Schleiferiaceae bacterium]|nr:hypothetical protein [Schleiferiaceae bacterium]